jgi:hypothetical protein
MADQITREEFADHMDAFEQRLGARSSRTDRRLETIDSRLDAIDGRLDTIETRLDVIDGRLQAASDHPRVVIATGPPPVPSFEAAPLAREPQDTHADEVRKANGVTVDDRRGRLGARRRESKPAGKPTRTPRMAASATAETGRRRRP